jgi:FtsP/CotA-like multicopper oxidase with cupredoxin domain
MKTIQKITRLSLPTIALFAATVIGSPCLAATDVYLVAKSFTKVMPDGVSVPMWGYALDADQNLATDGGETASSPGPRLVVPDTESILRIHLRNDLPSDTSLIIHGQATPLEPVWFTDGSGRQRVSSFTRTVAPGATDIYEWTGLQTGSYRYLSGTHQAVQIQMGLQGAMTHDFLPGQAYKKPHSAYANEVVLFYTEVDPALHAAVDGGTYGTAAYPSALRYKPEYFLVNGSPFTATTPALPAGATGEFTLLRLINGGLETHVPTLLGTDMGIIAEDGALLVAPIRTYAVGLHAGKVHDVLIRPSFPNLFPLYDRAMGITNSDLSSGGMISHLEVTAPALQTKLQGGVLRWGQKAFDADEAAQAAQLLPENTAKERAKKKKKIKATKRALASSRKRLDKLERKLAKRVETLGTLEEALER